MASKKRKKEITKKIITWVMLIAMIGSLFSYVIYALIA